MAQVPNFYVDGLNQNISGLTPWDMWDFDTNTPVSQIPDSTAAVQAVVNQAQASGFGGRIILPAGVIRLNGVTISAGGVTIEGAGWEEFNGAYNSNSPAQRGRRGTYIMTDTASGSFLVGTSGNNVSFLDMAFIQPQPPESGGWSPTGFGAPIQVAGSGSGVGGSINCERLLFWRCDQGIVFGSSGGTVQAGRLTVRDCRFACFSNGIIAASADECDLSNLLFSADLLAGNPQQQANMQAFCVGIFLDNCVKASVSDIVIKKCLEGLLIQNSSTSRCKARGLDMESVRFGVEVKSSNLMISEFSFVGAAIDAAHASIALDVSSGIGCVVLADGLQLSTFEGPAVATLASSTDVRLGSNVWVNNWNTAPPVSGFPNQAPALCATNASENIYYSNGTKFTNANGGPNTGGAGTVTGY